MKTVLLITLMLAALGCDGTYVAERTYWRVSRRYSDVMLNPQIASEENFNAAVEELAEIVNRYPGWNETPQVKLRIAQMYLERGFSGKAEEEYREVLRLYPERVDLCAKARDMLQRIRIDEGNIDTAKDVRPEGGPYD